jgi:hypothetical protein
MHGSPLAPRTTIARCATSARGAALALAFATLLSPTLLATRAAATVSPPTNETPDWKVVTATSVSNGNIKTVTATCPVDMQVVGAGGRIDDTGYGNPWTGPNGRVALTDVLPSSDLASVSVTAAMSDDVNWDPTLDRFTVTAQATCARSTGTPVVRKVTRVEAPSPNNGTTGVQKSATATCPDGQVVYGTGYQLSGAAGNVRVAALKPGSDLHSLTATAYVDYWARTGAGPTVADLDQSPFTAAWSLTTVAICGKSRGADALISSFTGNLGLAKTIDTLPCPLGTVVTGVGAETIASSWIVDYGTYVALEQLTVTSATASPVQLPGLANRATARGSVDLTDQWTLVVYGVCH